MRKIKKESNRKRGGNHNRMRLRKNTLRMLQDKEHDKRRKRRIGKCGRRKRVGRRKYEME